jgi:predicted RNA-binding protein with RPS1 domain
VKEPRTVKRMLDVFEEDWAKTDLSVKEAKEAKKEAKEAARESKEQKKTSTDAPVSAAADR